MAKVLSKTGVQTGQTIQAFHISQSVDAFTGLSAYNITISGGLSVNGYSFPTQDGIADQVMATDGSGNLTFQTLPLAATASYITSSGVKGPFGGDSITTASYAVSASHVEFADLASASYHAVNASDANTATSASYARTASVVTDTNVAFLDQNNTFTGTNQTFTNIIVNGTGSFNYFQSVTGSAKIIGDAYIILNNNTPAERYAGIKVQDSGSAGVTASLEFDGQTNDWFYEYSDDGGATTDHGVVLFGPEYATKGSPTYPTNNRIQKGTGGHHLADSSITDNGTTVSTSIPFTSTQITASSGFKGDLVGNVTGTATTASYVDWPNVDNKPALLSSSAQIASDISGAFNESSASFSTRITSLEDFSSSLDANYVTEAELVAATASLSASLAVDISTNKSNIDTLESKTLVSGSSQIILQSTTGDLSGSRIDGAVLSATSASYAASSSHAEFSDNSRNAVSATSATSASYALTASYALNAASATTDTGSLLTTASAAGTTLTFTKGDGSTFDVEISQTGSVQSASFASSASHAEFSDNSRDAVSASFAITASYVSGTVQSSSYASSASHAEFADAATTSVSASFAASASHSEFADSSTTSISASLATSASYVVSASYAITASHAEFSDNSAEAITASYAVYALTSGYSNQSGTASFADTSSIATSASYATSASHAEFSDESATATTASYALTASVVLGSIESASFATTASYAFSSSHEIIKEVSSSFADTASFALTASYALNAASSTTDTGSLLVTASAADNVITFTKGDSSTFEITVATGSATSASFASSASHAEFADNSRDSVSASFAITASHVTSTVSNAISASFAVTASYAVSSSVEIKKEVSSSFADTASFALTASYALNAASSTTDTGSLLVTASALNNTITFTKGDSSTFNVIINTGSAESASFATSASHAEFADESGISTSSSFASTASYVLGTVDNATSSSFAITASHVTSTVSNAISSSFAATASYAVSSSHEIIKEVSSSFADTASFALTASYALNAASTTTDTGSLLTTASAAANIITFTKGDSSTFEIVVATGSAESASFATSASHAEFSDEAGIATTATSASYALTASVLLGSIESASFATTASYAVSSSHEIIKEVSSSFADTASFALTASYALNAASIAPTGITGAYTASFTDLISGSFTHDLNTRNLVVTVYDTNYTEIIPETVTLSNLDTLFLDFGVSSSGHLVVTKVGGPSPNTYKTTISGNTTYTINHNLAEDYPLVQVYESGSRKQVVPQDITSLNSSSVQIDFNVNFDGNVIIKK